MSDTLHDIKSLSFTPKGLLEHEQRAFEAGRKAEREAMRCDVCMFDSNCKIQQEMYRQGFPKGRMGCLNVDPKEKI